MIRSNVIPDSKGEVQEKLLKFKPVGLSVEAAREAMLAAKEEATTTGGGTKVPTFLQEGRRGQGGNVSVNTEVVPSRSLLASAREKLSKLRIPTGARVNLNKMREAGMITQPEIDALMAAANGTPAAEPEKTPDIFEPEPAPQVESVAVETVAPERVPAAPESVAPVVPTSDPVTEGRETIDTKHFTAQIYKEGREWVAELIYKNGSGSERFTAPSTRELNKKLIEAKGNATIKVRDTVRRMKLGDKPDTWDFFFEQVKESHGLTIEQYNALPEASRTLVQDTVQAQQILAFTEAHPEYYATAKNFKTVADYLNKREWPLTLHNLELAYHDLSEEDDMLDLRPKPVSAAPISAPAPSSASTVVTAVEDSAAVVPEPPVVSTTSAPTPTTTPVRKRGSTGLMPGDSSAVPSEPTRRPEEGTIPTEPSVSELRKMPIDQLAGLAKRGRTYGRQL